MKSYAVNLNVITRLFWRVHRFLYLATRGQIGSNLFGWHVVLLKTVGRKTGKPRIVALNALKDNGRYIIAASYAGQPKHPAWFLNLQAKPEAEIFEFGTWVPVRAIEAQGEEKERLWSIITKRDNSYSIYQSRTIRQIPIVILEFTPGIVQSS